MAGDEPGTWKGPAALLSRIIHSQQPLKAKHGSGFQHNLSGLACQYFCQPDQSAIYQNKSLSGLFLALKIHPNTPLQQKGLRHPRILIIFIYIAASGMASQFWIHTEDGGYFILPRINVEPVRIDDPN